MRRFLVPGFVLLVWVGTNGAWPASAWAQTPSGAEATPSPVAPVPPPPPPPPPPADNGLFPGADGGGAPRTLPPPVPAAGELRAAGAARNNGAAGRRRRETEGGRFSGERRRRAESPSLAVASTDPVEVRIAYRRAETEVKRDPVFAELLHRADTAHDDEERRVLLRRYYVDLFARVRRINPSPALAAHVGLLARAAEQRYAPRRRAGGVDEREIGRDRGAGRR